VYAHSHTFAEDLSESAIIFNNNAFLAIRRIIFRIITANPRRKCRQLRPRNNFDSSLSASGRRTASLSEARVPARAENAKRDYGDTRHVRVHPQKERASNWRHAVRRRRDGRSVGVYVRFNTGWPREKRPAAAIAQARARSLASVSARAWPKKSSAKAPTLRARAIPRQGSSRELRPLRLADALRAATMATNEKGISPDDDATPAVALCRSSRVPKACSDSLPTQLR